MEEHQWSQKLGRGQFSARSKDQTEVNLKVEYEPEGMIENLGDLVGLVSARIFGDLNRFKDFIETKHTATGGWRGEILASAEAVGANI